MITEYSQSYFLNFHQWWTCKFSNTFFWFDSNIRKWRPKVWKWNNTDLSFITLLLKLIESNQMVSIKCHWHDRWHQIRHNQCRLTDDHQWQMGICNTTRRLITILILHYPEWTSNRYSYRNQHTNITNNFQTLKTQLLTYKLHVNTILPWFGHFLV